MRGEEKEEGPQRPGMSWPPSVGCVVRFEVKKGVLLDLPVEGSSSQTETEGVLSSVKCVSDVRQWVAVATQEDCSGQHYFSL